MAHYGPGKFEEVPSVAGMKPWLFEYDGVDGKYGITLYATDPLQALEDNCDRLDNLKLLGEVKGQAKARKLDD